MIKTLLKICIALLICVFIFNLLQFPYDYYFLWVSLFTASINYIVNSRQEDKDDINSIQINNNILKNNRKGMKGGATPGNLYYAQLVSPKSDFNLDKTKKDPNEK